MKYVETQTETTERLIRIEAKLDTLIRALAEEEEEPARTFEGEQDGEERDQEQPL